MTASTTLDLRRRLVEGRTAALQIAAVVASISRIDGYDVRVIRLAVLRLRRAWAIGKAALVLVLASGMEGRRCRTTSNAIASERADTSPYRQPRTRFLQSGGEQAGIHIDTGDSSLMDDVLAITQSVAKFAYRDQGRWDELRDLFQPDATIAVTWYSGPIEGFIERSGKMAAASKSATSKHWIGASRVTVAGDRALSDTDVSILVRMKLGPIEADLTSYLRFFDRFERCADGVWRIGSRTAIYEKDRVDPVRPSVLYPLLYRAAGFDRFPRPYRHLAAGLVRTGQNLANPIIEAGTKEEAALWRDARAWLEGGI